MDSLRNNGFGILGARRELEELLRNFGEPRSVFSFILSQAPSSLFAHFRFDWIMVIRSW